MKAGGRRNPSRVIGGGGSSNEKGWGVPLGLFGKGSFCVTQVSNHTTKSSEAGGRGGKKRGNWEDVGFGWEKRKPQETNLTK